MGNMFWQVFLLVKFWREGTIYLEELFYKGMTLVSQQLKFHLNSSFNTNLEKKYVIMLIFCASLQQMSFKSSILCTQFLVQTEEIKTLP